MQRMGIQAFTLPIALLLALTGCGNGQPDPNAVAVAKCHLPLLQALKVPTDQEADESDIRVRDLGGGRREVSGQIASPDGPSHGFICVVSPDASDKLRGLRVDRLDVQ